MAQLQGKTKHKKQIHKQTKEKQRGGVRRKNWAPRTVRLPGDGEHSARGPQSDPSGLDGRGCSQLGRIPWFRRGGGFLYQKDPHD